MAFKNRDSMCFRILNICCLLLFCFSAAFGQKPFSADYDGIASVIQLDSMVITAQQQGFDVEEFIAILRKDESFYRAFKNLHFFAHEATHQMAFDNKKGEQAARFWAKTRQTMLEDSCRQMKFLAPPKVSGRFFRRRGDYRYTTAEMYDRVFFTEGVVCEGPDSEKGEARGLQRYYEALKTFIFQPGERVDVPLISKKTALFDSELMPYYDYKISRGLYRGKIDSYIFTIEVKEDYRERKEGKTLVKYLQTYFRSSDFQVLGRNYIIENQGLASCLVEMSVALTYVQGVYLPEKVTYEGTWNIPGKRRETGWFEAVFSDFTR